MSYITEVAKSLKQSIDRQFEYRIINYGGTALYIEGFIRIVSVSESRMEFLLKKKTIVAEGTSLVLEKLTTGAALIEGEVKSVYESK